MAERTREEHRTTKTIAYGTTRCVFSISTSTMKSLASHFLTKYISSSGLGILPLLYYRALTNTTGMYMSTYRIKTHDETGGFSPVDVTSQMGVFATHRHTTPYGFASDKHDQSICIYGWTNRPGPLSGNPCRRSSGGSPRTPLIQRQTDEAFFCWSNIGVGS